MKKIKLKTLLLCLSIPLSYTYAKKDKGQNYKLTTVVENVAANKQQRPEFNELLTHYQWLQLKDLPQSYYELFKVEHTTPKDSVILMVRSSFLIQNTISKYNENFYLSATNLERLSGMEYKESGTSTFDIEFSPFPFYNIEAKAKVLVPESKQDYDFLNIASDDSFLVHLKSYDFTSDLYQSDIITVFSPVDNLTRVDNVSFALLTDDEIDSFIMNRKKSVMISKLKKQSKVMLKMYSK